MGDAVGGTDSGIVIDIEFNVFDAGLRPGAIVCCLPRAVEQCHLTEVLHRQAAPVIGCARGLETAFAVAAVLVAQHLEWSMFVPAQ